MAFIQRLIDTTFILGTDATTNVQRLFKESGTNTATLSGKSINTNQELRNETNRHRRTSRRLGQGSGALMFMRRLLTFFFAFCLSNFQANAQVVGNFTQGSFSTPTCLVIDCTADTFTAAYGTVKLTAAYAGNCMTIKRTSDSTTTTIGFSGNDCDQTTASTFCASTICYVTLWNDQSGNGKNCSNTAASGREAKVVFSDINGKMSLDFAGHVGGFPGNCAVNITSQTSSSFNIVANINGNSSPGPLIGLYTTATTQTSSERASIAFVSGSNYNFGSSRTDGTSTAITGNNTWTQPSWKIGTATSDQVTPIQKSWLNGTVASTSATSTSIGSMTGLVISMDAQQAAFTGIKAAAVIVSTGAESDANALLVCNKLAGIFGVSTSC